MTRHKIVQLEAGFDNIHWTGFLRSIPKKKLIATIFYGIVRILVSAAWPYLIYHYIQTVHNSPFSQIITIVAATMAAFVVTGIAAHRQSLLNISIMEDFSQRLAEQLWEKIQKLDWLVFHSKNRVYFFDVVMTDAWRLRLGFMALIEFIVINGVVTCALTFFIIFINWPLFVLCVAGLFVLGGVHFFSTVKMRPFVKSFQNAWRVQHHWIAKTVDQFDLVKMGRGYSESEKSNRKNTAAFIETNSSLLKAQSKYRSLNQGAGNVVRIIIFLTGFYWVQVHYVSLPDLVLVLLIVTIVQNNVLQLPGAMHTFIEGQESKNNIIDFFNLPDEEHSPIQDIEDLEKIESISIEGLSFSYNDEAVINNDSLFLEKGKIYLWQGGNGSGKSTTAHILLGLLTPQHGSLSINGTKTDWLTLKTLRRRFAFLDQDAPLFGGSVRENILFGNIDAESSWNYLQSTWLSALLPSGSDPGEKTLGEKGEGLSGGEARRLALIREWISVADVFILDEPLNHLDDYAINEIKKEIVNIKDNCIIIIISHQQGFEAIADEIKQF